jgi:MFS family permease
MRFSSHRIAVPRAPAYILRTADRSRGSLAMTSAPLPSHAGGLGSRTFIGLLVAQFLAAFNDQAIHASAMFFAINTQAFTEENAIGLMPILFYAPWALFGTVAGWLADRYSKRNALVLWKVAEVAITAIALVGFYLGRNGYPEVGPLVVLATVFLMGTHSCFFVPAKYGVMPEILPHHQLSKGNGILESLSFLAVILGTVSGGVLSYLYQGQEVIVGFILLALALSGAFASLLIRKMPASNPFKPFPRYVYAPLVASIRVLLSTRALRVALLGIAFFTFVVAFMRAAVYMLGESQNPRWDELKTSAVVGTVALGIGLGSPLAGFLSGKRVEPRLVISGALGMMALLVGAAYFIGQMSYLIACIIGIGFFTGFYIVPLFTLLQHKAPKTSKGEMIATSNFVNVTGAIAATALFKVVVVVAHLTGYSPAVSNRVPVGSGELVELALNHGRPVYFEIRTDDRQFLRGGTKPDREEANTLGNVTKHLFEPTEAKEVLEVEGSISQKTLGGRIDVSKFEIDGVVHYDLVPAGKPPTTDYDNRRLPSLLFLGAAVLTLGILLALTRPLLQVRREEG